MTPHAWTRRSFLGVGLGMPWMLGAAESFARKGPPRLRLSLAAYSFGAQFARGKDGAPAQMDMFRFIDFCAAHGCEGAELTSYYFPDPLPEGYLSKVRRHAFLAGVTVSGTAVGNTFTLPVGPERDREIASVRTWIERAAVLGAPHIRVFAGDSKGTPLAEAKRRTIEALEEVGEVAGRHGIFLGVENHGGIVSESSDLLDIIQAVRSPWVGINLDIGNFNTADPYADLARCAPFAVNVQYKGLMRPRGSRGTVPTDLPRVVKLLRDAGYQGWFVLEYEMPDDPWKKVPVMLSEMAAAIRS